MYALIVLAVIVAYAALMIGAVAFGWRWGRRNGGSRRKAAAFAFIGFLVVYLPLFWNVVPVLLKHRWLCATDAGFTQYVDPFVWRAAHANEIKALTHEQVRKETRTSSGELVSWRIYGDLLEIRRLSTESYFLAVPFFRSEQQLLSTANHQLLAKVVNYQIFAGSDFRSNIFPRSCQAPYSVEPYPMEQYIWKLKREQ